MPIKKNRIITVVENGKQLYKGPDKRAYDQDYKPRIMGMPIMDFIKISLYVGGAIIFLVKADQRLNSVESSSLKITSVLERLIEWTQNSDNWNSAQYGTTFKDGRPINDRYMEWSKSHDSKK